MARANFQVLVIPYIIKENEVKYGMFLRSDMNVWQFIAGGGEDDETPLEAAKREANEEANIPYDSCYYTLDTCCSISVDFFRMEDRKRWGNDCFVIPEHCFAVKMENEDITLSHEHLEFRWMSFEEARGLLRFDSNRTALGELRARIEAGLVK